MIVAAATRIPADFRRGREGGLLCLLSRAGVPSPNAHDRQETHAVPSSLHGLLRKELGLTDRKSFIKMTPHNHLNVVLILTSVKFL